MKKLTTLYSKNDKRLIDVINVLEFFDFDKTHKVLSLGLGEGYLESILSKKVDKLVCIGLNINFYIKDMKKYKANNPNIEVLEMNLENMSFADGSFDFVIASHILEHCLNPGLAINQIKRVLKPNGMFLVFVPPHEYLVVDSHFSVGWSVGQLMYFLAVGGFDVVNGKFFEYSYNVFGAVRRSELSLPKLRYDSGDFKVLRDAKILPENVFEKSDNLIFPSYIKQYNWDNKFPFKNKKYILVNCIFNAVFSFLGRKIKVKIRIKLGYLLVKIGRKLIRGKNF